MSDPIWFNRPAVTGRELDYMRQAMEQGMISGDGVFTKRCHKLLEQITGSRTRVKVVKNKIAPPFREAEYDIINGTGISKEGDILYPVASFDIVEKSGTWCSFKGERMVQGR